MVQVMLTVKGSSSEMTAVDMRRGFQDACRPRGDVRIWRVRCRHPESETHLEPDMESTREPGRSRSLR